MRSAERTPEPGARNAERELAILGAVSEALNSSPDVRQALERLLATIACQVGIAIERARLGGGATHLARAEQRTRIAHGIHDTLAKGLAAVAVNIESGMIRLETPPDHARERLARALAVARETSE